MGGRGGKGNINGFIDWLSKEGKGGGSPHPLDISKFGNMSLEDAERRIRNLKHEELFVFDKDGKLIEAYKGNATSVSFPMSVLDYKGATVTHGHPKGAADFGGTFSFADVKNMLESKWAEHRATASGQGEMNYIMRKGQGAKPKAFYNQINRDYKQIERYLSDRYTKAYDDALKDGKSKQSAIHMARQMAVGYLNDYWRRTAPKFGYEFITRKKDYTYNR